jgi:hypothetical protein
MALFSRRLAHGTVGEMKTQQTYTLSTRTVETVRRLVEEEQVAPSRDVLVERALADYFLIVRHEREARQFAAAAADPEIQAEIADLEQAFAWADRETWPG